MTWNSIEVWAFWSVEASRDVKAGSRYMIYPDGSKDPLLGMHLYRVQFAACKYLLRRYLDP